MGSLIGHVAPGLGFFIIGVWHLYNHLKLLALKGPSDKSLPWFPFTHLRRLELYIILTGCTASVAMELFIGPQRHQPLDLDGTIPTNHLRNFEHSSISFTFFVYAAFALILDKSGRHRHAQYSVLQLIGATAFAQELLLFYLHSTDHKGVEGQYHFLLQLVIFVSLLTTLVGIGYNTSFIIAFIRSLSILYQGVWLMVIGFALYTPSLIAKGCFIDVDDGHKVVRCGDNDALNRAKALVNIVFSWFLILLAVFSASFYVLMMKIYVDNKVDYSPMSLTDEEDQDVEAQKIGSKVNEKQSFINDFVNHSYKK